MSFSENCHTQHGMSESARQRDSKADAAVLSSDPERFHPPAVQPRCTAGGSPVQVCGVGPNLAQATVQAAPSPGWRQGPIIAADHPPRYEKDFAKDLTQSAIKVSGRFE